MVRSRTISDRMLRLPMRVGGQIIGVLAGDSFVNKRPISYDQMQALMVLANQGAVMIDGQTSNKTQLIPRLIE